MSKQITEKAVLNSHLSFEGFSRMEPNYLNEKWKAEGLLPSSICI
jgi:hypothetical protein